MRRHALVLAVVVMGTAGCRHHEQFVYEAHERYEEARQSGQIEPAAGDVQRKVQRIPSRRAPVRGRLLRPDRRQAFHLYPRTPYVGSAEWREEQAQAERRERDIRRRLESICAAC